MHSSRMRTARSLTVSPYLVVSHACPPWEQPCMPPWSNHAHPPQSNHTCPPRATMHAPWEQPCTPPGATTHAPPEQPLTPPGATMHAPLPRSNHARPPPGATMHAPPVNRITDRCKNNLRKLRLRAVKMKICTLRVSIPVHFRFRFNSCLP